MVFREFGSKNKPVIIFLHGGGVSWWTWKKHIDALQNDYFIVAPTIDGHGDAWSTGYHNLGESAEKVIGYIRDNCNGKVLAICGLSLGAQMTVEILSRESTIAEYAVIESALVYPIRMITALTAPMYSLCFGLIKKVWFARLQAKSLCVPDELFGNYYNDSILMTKESLINMTRDNGNYSMPKSLCNAKTKALILVGERELPVMKKSAQLLHDTLEGSVLKVVEKGKHGEISLKRTGEYLDLLKNLFIQ